MALVIHYKCYVIDQCCYIYLQIEEGAFANHLPIVNTPTFVCGFLFRLS